MRGGLFVRQGKHWRTKGCGDLIHGPRDFYGLNGYYDDGEEWEDGR